jgi:hypothetical protein
MSRASPPMAVEKACLAAMWRINTRRERCTTHEGACC